MNTLATETIQLATTECNKEHTTLDLYNHIVDEVYSRAKNGDTFALDILRKVFNGEGGSE